MNRLFLFLLLPFALAAQQTQARPQQKIPPEQIERELAEAEAQYDHALSLFNPWYTGPLITPSATMVPPGSAMWQPYIYFTDNYGAFDEDRKWVDAPNRFIVQTQPIILQVGVTPSVDTTLIMGTVARWQQDKFSGGFSDTLVQLGFLVTKQTLWAPKAKFTVGQSFPTGKYKNLDPSNLGLDGTGIGAYATTFTLTFGKVLFWATDHPMNTRLSMGYTVPTSVKVTNFNAYGGGYGTNGTVHPGNSFNIDLGLELSINQPWVAALDLVYNCSNSTSFNGNPGTTTPGGATPASSTGPFNDQFSLAPAIEYNFNENMGILWGVWFTVYGRNAPNFVSGIFSWYWEFPN